MQILIASATELEIQALLMHLDKEWEKFQFINYTRNGTQIYPLVTGIGCMNTAFSLSRFTKIQQVDLVLHLGIGGSYSRSFQIGEVVEIVSEQWGDLGAENANGEFIDVFELKLMEKDHFPFKNGKIYKSPKSPQTSLRQLSGLSVNKCSGSEPNISQLKEKYNADIENMEGMGLFYACRQMDIPFISIRSISNYVEARKKELWEIKKAIDHLNDFAKDYIYSLTEA